LRYEQANADVIFHDLYLVQPQLSCNSLRVIENAVAAIPMAMAGILTGYVQRFVRRDVVADDPHIFLHQSLIQGSVLGQSPRVPVRGLNARQQKQKFPAT